LRMMLLPFLVACLAGAASAQLSAGAGEGNATAASSPGLGYFSQPPYLVPLDIGNYTACNISMRRSILVADASTIVTTELANLGSPDCILNDFAFIDSMPPELAESGQISFAPAYFSRVGSTVVFVFPSFSPGESVDITYSFNVVLPASSITLLNSTRMLTSTHFNTTLRAGSEPASQQPEKPTGPCTPEIYCAPFGQCIDGYRTQRCADINQCPQAFFYRVEACPAAGNQKKPLDFFAQMEQAICSTHPELCTGEQQDSAGLFLAMPALALALILAASIVQKRMGKKVKQEAA
jgi:hypothetical protein